MRRLKLVPALFSVSLLAHLLFVVSYAFADDSIVAPGDFFSMVWGTITSFGGMSWVLKISAVVTLVIASMKVSFLNQLIWSKLGQFKAWLAPILGMLGGIASLALTGSPITLSSVFSYLAAGAGAVLLHELLDTIKGIPGIGPVYVGIIDAIEAVLGGPGHPVVPVSKK